MRFGKSSKNISVVWDIPDNCEDDGDDTKGGVGKHYYKYILVFCGGIFIVASTLFEMHCVLRRQTLVALVCSRICTAQNMSFVTKRLFCGGCEIFGHQVGILFHNFVIHKTLNFSTPGNVDKKEK